MAIPNSGRSIPTATWSRWRDFLVYTAAGTTVFEIAYPLGWKVAAKLSPPSAFQPWFVWLVTLVAVFVTAFIVAEPIRIRRRHWRLIGRYPPLWLSVAASFAVAIVIAELPASLRPTQGVPFWAEWWIVGVLGAAFVLAVMLRQVPWQPRPANPMVVDPSADVIEWAALKNWFALEQPSERDFFGHGAVSERIATTLLDSVTEQAVALLGPFGSGKSSALARVRRSLEDSDDPFVIVAEFNGWAVPEAADAPRIALERLVEALGLFVDVQQFRGLPDTYKRLVAAEPSGFLAKIVGTNIGGEPLDQLRQLEPVLEALGARLVLFVEDADRAGDEFDSRHLSRLLTTLRDVRRISFVLSIDGSRNVRLDYRKLCDTIEIVPQLSSQHLFAVLATAYKHWLSDVPFIDPRDKNESRLRLDRPLDELLTYVQRRIGGSPLQGLANLVESPRRIKHLVRRVDRVWTNLRGEVDLDDLIVISALRDLESRAVFDFIAENIDVAREDPGQGPLKGKDVTKGWKAVVDGERKSDAVQQLVQVLGIRQLSAGRQVTTNSAPQGARIDEPTDYFRRILQEQLLPGEVRDQQVLADIERWNKDRGGEMVVSLFAAAEERTRYVQVWEYFAWRIEDDELFVLVERLLSETLEVDGPAASMKGRSALLAVWRRLNRRPRRADAVAWLNAQIGKALPISLRMADDLLYYWAGEHGVVPNVVSDDGWLAVRRTMLDQARDTFKNSDVLLRTLTDTEEGRSSYALVHFVRPPARRDHVDIEPRDREWLAPLLLDAAKLNPRLIVANLIHIVGDEDVWAGLPENDASTLLERIYKLRPEHVDTIFGEYAVPLLEVIANNDAQDDVARSAAIQAKKRLAEIAAEGTASAETAPTSVE